jgi:outer membrane biosynthesis protein TonB
MLKNGKEFRFKWRVTALVLAALLVCTAFTACGAASPDADEETQVEAISVDETEALPSPEAISVADAAVSDTAILNVTDAGIGAETTGSGVDGGGTTDSAVDSDAAKKADAEAKAKEKQAQEEAKSKEKDSKKSADKKKKSDKATTPKADDKKKESDKEATPTAEAEKITVSVAADCLTLFASDPEMAALVSDKGVILAKKNVTVTKDASVYDVMKASGLSFVGKAYIESINGLSERDAGSKSGWVYSVNGVFPGKGILKYTVKAGDAVAFRYTLDGGPDVK